MNCEKYKKLIEKYIEGDISNSQLEELKVHIESCTGCCEDFENCTRIQDAIQRGLSPQRTSERARESIYNAVRSSGTKEAGRFRADSRLLWKPLAVAASVLFVGGLFAGLYLGKMTSSEQVFFAATKKVPIEVKKVEGIVLVKHKGSNFWKKLAETSRIFVGDIFCSTSKSKVILEFEDKSFVELNQNSMLVLSSFNGETEFYLEQGKMRASLESPHPPFVVGTPNGRVEALGTEFTITVE